MQTTLRLLMVVLFAAWTGSPLLAATKSQEKKTTKSESSAKKKTTTADKEAPSKKAASDKEAPAQKKPAPAPAPGEDDVVAETAHVMTPAAVSTISIEDISGFDQYPKQIQSLVQSSLALTHLELGYLYGSSEPNQGGMDCSGTIYHVLHFQGLKEVPRQSDEMCQWVDKKAQLHLTPTATSFASEEFDNLKPGDLLFWTNTTATTRKLPVTHVMVYLGKLKKSGKRIVFGSSDGRSFHGERRSGVSVFDFTLPRAESPSHFYGYGPVPGLVPVVEPPEPERPVIAQTPTAPKEKETPPLKEVAVTKAPATPKETLVVKAAPTPKEPATTKATPSAPKEEVRRAIALSTDDKASDAKIGASDSAAKPELKKAVVADAAPKTKATTTAKSKPSVTKKKSTTTVASNTRRRTPTPVAPQKSLFQQRVDQTVNSVRRFFQQ